MSGRRFRFTQTQAMRPLQEWNAFDRDTHIGIVVANAEPIGPRDKWGFRYRDGDRYIRCRGGAATREEAAEQMAARQRSAP